MLLHNAVKFHEYRCTYDVHDQNDIEFQEGLPKLYSQHKVQYWSHAMYFACKYRQSSEELERVIYPKWGVSSVHVCNCECCDFAG